MKDTKTKFLSQPSPIDLAHMLAFLLGRPGAQWTMLLGLAVLAVGPLPIQAATAVTEAWAHHFSNVLSNSVDRPSKAVRDSAGDIIVAGTSDNNASGPDILTIKYSGVDGSMLWQRRQQYSASARYSWSNGLTSVPVAIAVDASGNVVVSGFIEYPDNESESEYYTAKYARATGAVLWEKRYYPGEFQPVAVAVVQTGDVVVIGGSAMLKYAGADGVLLWEKKNIYNHAAVVDSTGNVVLTGVIYNTDNIDHVHHTAKYAAADGGLLWEKIYNGPSNHGNFASAVAVDPNGNVIVTGSSWNDEDLHSYYYTIKYAAVDGAVMWERQGGTGSNSKLGHVRAVAVDANGNVVVTGESYSEKSGIDYYTVKYAAAEGALLWEKRYDGPANPVSPFFGGGSWDFAQAVALDADGNAVVTGFSTSITDSEPTDEYRPFDIYTAKYGARDGTLLWERRYESNAHFPWNSTSQSAAGAAVVLDESGNAIVTGPSFVDDIPFQNKPHFYTARYAANDGALLWQNTYNGPAHHESYADAVSMDTSGNVVITATSETDSYIAKYAASDGALLWEKLTPAQLTQVALDASGSVFVSGMPYAASTSNYIAKYTPGGSLSWKRNETKGSALISLDPLGNLIVASESYTSKYASSSGDLIWKKQYSTMEGSRQASAIAVDNRGNVAVTGSVSPTRYDGYTARYAAMDGALLWESRTIGSGFTDGVGHAVAVDSSGNAVVITSNATLKYAAVDGALLWEKRYTNIRALALDAGGNVAITGSFGTRRLAAADGALLWEKRYNGPANLNDVANAVAVDGSGNVVVTGQSQGSLYTVKYAAADGGLLWEKRYKEPGSFGNWAGGPHSLALGPNGMIAIIGSSSLRSTGPSDVLTVMFREGLSPLSVEPLLTGIRLSFTGTAGQSYSIQRAPVVTGPWNTINTQTTPTPGLLEYIDANAPAGAAFYRTRQP